MKVYLKTGVVETDQGEVIKKLNCPSPPRWSEMSQGGSGRKICSQCDRAILDTEGMSDDMLLGMLREKPDTCLKISPCQGNVVIVP